MRLLESRRPDIERSRERVSRIHCRLSSARLPGTFSQDFCVLAVVVDLLALRRQRIEIDEVTQRCQGRGLWSYAHQRLVRTTAATDIVDAAVTNGVAVTAAAAATAPRGH